MIQRNILGCCLALLLLGALPGQTASAAQDPLKGIWGQNTGEPDFLPPDEAFRFSGEVGGPNTLQLRWVIADGYYLYKSRIQVKTDSALVQLGPPELPLGEFKTDEYFGTQEVYHQQVEAGVPFSRASPGAATFEARVTYQGCAQAGLCYPPITKKLNLSLLAIDANAVAGIGAATGPGGMVSEQDRLVRILQSGNLLVVAAMFFAFGLGLSLTPCVLPMVPILSGIIVGQGKSVTTRRAFLISLAYVLGMAVTYTTAGAAFALAGKQVQAFFQETWILVLFAMLFVALALAMFGLYELQVPASLQTRLAKLSNRQRAGSYFGTAIMGALSALIVTTCVAPPLIATFVVIGQAGELLRGALALFALSIGMGAPLLVVGASAGKLLPKTGAWMEMVKKFFGVLFLGVAIYTLERVLPGHVTLALWGILLILAALLLVGFQKSTGGGGQVIGRTLGVAAAVWGATMLVGAAAGNADPFQPLKGLRAGAGSAALAHAGPEFTIIRTPADLDRELAAASAAGKPAMLDFSAAWCVSCKEMEEYTFPDAGVQAALASVVLLRADVTENNANDAALLSRFGAFGPPTIAFFGPDGIERKDFRLVGFVKADKFREHVILATGAVPAT